MARRFFGCDSGDAGTVSLFPSNLRKVEADWSRAGNTGRGGGNGDNKRQPHPDFPNEPYMPPLAAVKPAKPTMSMKLGKVSDDSLETFRKLAKRAGDAATADVYKEEAEFAEGFVATTEWEAGRYATRL